MDKNTGTLNLHPDPEFWSNLDLDPDLGPDPGLSSLIKKTVLQSRNYLFPVSTLTIISAPAPAPAIAIYWHLKLF